MTVVTFLGIFIDEKLNWNTLSVMHKASMKINIDGMYTLYCSLFHPYLSYCLEIWGNTYASNIKCLFTMQTKAIRLLCGADRLAHTNPLFKEMSILKLPDFVNYKTAIMMFNIFHRLLPTQLKIYFLYTQALTQHDSIRHLSCHRFEQTKKQCAYLFVE